MVSSKRRVLIMRAFMIVFAIDVLSAAILMIAFKPVLWALSIWLAFNVLTLLIAECGFQIAYRCRSGKRYTPTWGKFEELQVEPHPYLSYACKKNFKCRTDSIEERRFNTQPTYKLLRLPTNNLRNCDGVNGDRTVLLPKPPGQIRILCLGASTTNCYLELDGKRYSYPLELEKELRGRLPGKDIVVQNCGHDGWLSADILIHFLLNLCDSEPDFVILYHGYNDLLASLTPNFSPDYAHARKNLGEVYHLFRLSSKLPKLPLGLYMYIVQSLFPLCDERQGLLNIVSRGRPDLNADFAGLKTYSRNITHLIHACKANGITLILSSFAHYLHPAIQNSKVHNKFRVGVLLENKETRELAQRHSVR